MSAPIHAPERRPMSAPPPAGPRPRPMSPERRRRLRRTLTLAALAFVLLLWAVTRAFGGEDAPTRADATAKRPTTPASPGSAGVSASAGAAPSETPGAADPTTVPAQGDGKLTIVAVPGADTARPGKTVTFGVEVEGGLGIDAGRFAAQVRQILSDPRGWESADGIHFVALSPEQRAAGATPDIRVTLASPALTDQLCSPLQTQGKVSCNRHGRAVINALRWTAGVEHFPDLQEYRTYVINHEVGHGLWHPHENCPGPGQRAPIMQQQTLALEGCVAWPYPTTGG